MLVHIFVSPFSPQMQSLISDIHRNRQLCFGIRLKHLIRSSFIYCCRLAEPLEMILNLQLLSEDKNVPYLFVSSRQAPGPACGVSRSVIPCPVTIKEGSKLKQQIQSIHQSIERLLIQTSSLCHTPC
ncbi:hypothetical protein AB1E19_015284 [Capra hircus]